MRIANFSLMFSDLRAGRSSTTVEILPAGILGVEISPYVMLCFVFVLYITISSAWKFWNFVVELNIWFAESKYVWWLVNEAIIFNRFHIKYLVTGFEDLEPVCKSEPRTDQFTSHLLA